MLKLHLNYDELDAWHFTLNTAKQAHGTQQRKYTNEPYWHHVASVAATVSRVEGRTIQMIQAALLHDVLEDTEMDLVDVHNLFGPDVASLVWALTDDDKKLGNRAARKAATCNRLAMASAEVQTIKLADLLDNTSTIVERDPDFAKVYMREKRILVTALTKGNVKLRALANLQLTAYYINEEDE